MDVWRRVDELVDLAGTPSALHSHRMHLYAAWRWRDLGRVLDPELAELERGALVQRLATPGVVAHVREAYDGPLLLLKGADVAALYPRPELRPSLDLDFLVPDARRAHRALVEHGFRVCEETPESHHHLPTLEWPGLLTRVDVHEVPSWPSWASPPPVAELFAAASDDSALGHSVERLPPSMHTLVLAAHMWREEPFTRLGQLLDVWLMSQQSDPAEVTRLAQAWGIESLWRSTDQVVRGVLAGERAPSRVARRRAKRLGSMRERTVLGSKLAVLVAPYSALPAIRATRVAVSRVASDLRPEPGQSWRSSLGRAAGGLRQGMQPRAARDRSLEARD